MAIKYKEAPDIETLSHELIRFLGWTHIHLEHVAFIRSHGSKARRTIARCHALGKAMQIGMKRKKGFYLVEVISEIYDKLPRDEQVKTVIHELMHIPKSFGGGFVHHDKVHEHSVGKIYEQYICLKEKEKSEEANFAEDLIKEENKSIIAPIYKRWF